MKAHVVIGANFGDEGKGRTVDYLAGIAEKPLVIRYNSGAQAGHTVVRNGMRYVFHHMGSGTFAGAPTYLGKEFVTNPFIWHEEHCQLQQLMSLDLKKMLILHPSCKVTTPWDMLYNQAVEDARAQKRHGSCGVGLHATKVRHETIPLTVSECFADNSVFPKHVSNIIGFYEAKFKEQGLDIPEAFWNRDMLADFREYASSMVRLCGFCWKLAHLHHKTYIFESAQGLLLDQDHEWFPHVTHAHTGTDDLLSYYDDQDIDLDESIRLHYVTRGYLTRHGAGPLPGEDSSLYYPDDTNIQHDFQGTLRYAPLNLDLIVESILRDSAKLGIDCSRNLVVTCLDQLPAEFDIVRYSTKRTTNIAGLFDAMRKTKLFDTMFGSYQNHGDMINHTLAAA